MILNMRNFKFLLIFLCGGVFLFSCNLANRGRSTITGRLSGAGGEQFILQELGPTEVQRVDSVVADEKGSFIFKVSPAGQCFYLLQSKSGRVLVLTLDENERAEVSGGFDEFPDMTRLEGTPDNILLQSFFEFTRKNERKVDSLEMLLVEHQDSADYYVLTLKLDAAFKQIWEKQRHFEQGFIDKNSGSLVSLIVLNYAFGMSPVLSPEEDSAWYVKLDKSLNAGFPDNKHVKYHHQRVMEFRRQQEVKNLKR